MMKKVILAWTLCLAAGSIGFYLKSQDGAYLPSLSELPKCKVTSPDSPHTKAHQNLIKVMELLEMGRISDGRDFLGLFLLQHQDLQPADRRLSYALSKIIEGLSLQSSNESNAILPPQIFAQIPPDQVYCLRRTIVLFLLRKERNLAAAEQAAELAAATDDNTHPDAKAKRSAQYLFAYSLAKAGQLTLSRGCSKMGLDAALKAADTSEIALWKQLLRYLDSQG